jgi:hypothetical protein
MPKLMSLWTDLVIRVLKHHLLTVKGFQAAVARLGKPPLKVGTDNTSAARRWLPAARGRYSGPIAANRSCCPM